LVRFLIHDDLVQVSRISLSINQDYTVRSLF
jgi:hypothetical protein